jgi:chromosome segregation ATPase
MKQMPIRGNQLSKEFSQPHDIEKLLRLLFLERKRVKDLNEKVQELDSERDRLEHQVREEEAPPPPQANLEDERRVAEKLKRLVVAQRARIQELERADRTAELQATVDQLTSERQRFEERMTALQEVVIRSNEGIRDFQQLRQDHSQLQSQWIADQERVAELEERYEKTLLKAKTFEQRLGESEERWQGAEALYTELTGEQAETLSQLEQIKREYAEIKNLYEERSNDKLTLRAELDRREEEVALLRKEVTEEMVHRAHVASERQRERTQFDHQLLERSLALEELQLRISQMVDQSEVTLLSNELAEARRALEEQEQRLRKEAFEIRSQLAAQLDDKSRTLDQLQRYIADETVDKKELRGAKEEIEELKRRHALLCKEQAEATERESQLQSALDLAESEIERANHERIRAELAGNELEANLAQLRQEQERQVAQFGQRLEAALKEAAFLKSELAENERLYVEIESHKESFELAHHSHRLEIQQLHESHQEISDHLNRQLVDLEERLATAQQELAGKSEIEAHMASLQTDLVLHQTTADQFRLQCDRLQEACDSAHKQLLEREETLQKLQSQSRLFQEEQVALRRQVREREHQLQAAQRHLAKKLKEQALLQQSNDQLKMQLSDQDKAVSDYKSEMVEVGLEKALAEEKMRSAESRTRQAEAELHNWKRNHADLESEAIGLRKRLGELEQIRDRYVRVDAEYRQMRQIFSSIQSSLGNVGTGHVVEAYPVNELVGLETRSGRSPSPPTVREDREIAQTDLFNNLMEQPAGAIQEDLFG